MDANDVVKLHWMDPLCAIMRECDATWLKLGPPSAGIAAITVAYSEFDFDADGECVTSISFTPATDAAESVKKMCHSGKIGNYLFDVPPGMEVYLNEVRTGCLPLREMVKRAFLEVMRAIEIGEFVDFTSGAGECTLAMDGSAHVAHSPFDSFEVGFDADTARKFVRQTDGKVYEDESALLRQPLITEELTSALMDALTALRDLNAGYPAKELHKPVVKLWTGPGLSTNYLSRNLTHQHPVRAREYAMKEQYERHVLEPNCSYQIVTVGLSFEPWPTGPAARHAAELGTQSDYVRDTVSSVLRGAVGGVIADYEFRIRYSSDRVKHACARLAIDGQVPQEEIEATLSGVFASAVASGALRSWKRDAWGWDVVTSAEPSSREVFGVQPEVREMIDAIADRRAKAARLDHMIVALIGGCAGDSVFELRLGEVSERLGGAAREVFRSTPLMLSTVVDGISLVAVGFEVPSAATQREADSEADSVYNYLASLKKGEQHGMDMDLLAFDVARVWATCDAGDAIDRLQDAINTVRRRAHDALAGLDWLPEDLDLERIPRRWRAPEAAAAAIGMSMAA